MNNMSENWSDISPKHEWIDWGKHIKTYADTNKDRQETQFEGTGQKWINEFEQFLRDDAKNSFTHHLLVAQLSYNFFLPIFEENPKAWNAVRKMPTSKGKMSEYMREWHQNVDNQDKRFVEAIAKEIGISVDTGVVASTINADVNNDGYVDLSDVLIVRSAIQNSVSYDTDVNGDGKTDEVDVLIVKAKAHAAIAAAAPSLIRRKKITTWGALKRKQ